MGVILNLVTGHPDFISLLHKFQNSLPGKILANVSNPCFTQLDNLVRVLCCHNIYKAVSQSEVQILPCMNVKLPTSRFVLKYVREVLGIVSC